MACHTVVLGPRSRWLTPRLRRGHIRVSAAVAPGYGWETRCTAVRSSTGERQNVWVHLGTRRLDLTQFHCLSPRLDLVNAFRVAFRAL